jgi:hypothetical protein
MKSEQLIHLPSRNSDAQPPARCTVTVVFTTTVHNMTRTVADSRTGAGHAMPVAVVGVTVLACRHGSALARGLALPFVTVSRTFYYLYVLYPEGPNRF